LFDVDFVDAEGFGEAFRLDQRRISFAKRNDVLFVELRKNQFLLRPDAARASQARVEKPLPLGRRLLLYGIDVMANFEQAATRFASINDLVEAIPDTAPRKALEP